MTGKISFIDYGSDDFSPYQGILKGTWFMIGVALDSDPTSNVIVQMDRENFDNLLSAGECYRMSQLYGRTMEFDTEKQSYRLT